LYAQVATGYRQEQKHQKFQEFCASDRTHLHRFTFPPPSPPVGFAARRCRVSGREPGRPAAAVTQPLSDRRRRLVGVGVHAAASVRAVRGGFPCTEASNLGKVSPRGDRRSLRRPAAGMAGIAPPRTVLAARPLGPRPTRHIPSLESLKKVLPCCRRASDGRDCAGRQNSEPFQQQSQVVMVSIRGLPSHLGKVHARGAAT